ncbi:MAG: hypothetical protein JSV99_00760 [Planctomycetota bacterium]|nr:MAG: hypothetical protein JSV99_00760 [Planctomycetota bacterium]
MEEQAKSRINVFIVLCLFLSLCAISATKGGETVTVPVIVNVVGDTNAGDVNEAIETASDILGQAGISLDIARVNSNVQYGNGDSNLTEAEGDTAAVLGEGELYGTYGSGTGLKITIAGNVWTEKPTTAGWAVHEDQVAFVEPNPDTNEYGKTIAHELAHLLTLNYDLNDVNSNEPNRLMWWQAGGGPLLDANEINEIFPMAKWRGRPKFVPWEPPPKKKRRAWKGWDYLIDGRGWILDTLYDQSCAKAGFDPLDPNVGSSDIRTAGMYWERPLDPCDNIIFRIRVREHFDVDSFFDIMFKVGIDSDPDPEADAELSMHVYANPPDANLYGEASFNNFETGLLVPVELIINENYKFDGGEPNLANHSLECDVPSGYFGPGSDPFDGGVCSVNSVATFPDAGFDSNFPVSDTTEEFTFVVGWNDDPCCDPCETCEEPWMGLFEPEGDTGKLGITATGFPPGSIATIMMDGQEVGATVVRTNGAATAWIDEPLAGQNHTIKLVARVVDPLNPDVTRYTTARAYFRSCPDGVIDGDLDDDCDVDFLDFKVLADDWLAGIY